ncbi:MAG: PTS glucose transporter subunit IIA [Faecalibacterium sp.]
MGFLSFLKGKGAQQAPSAGCLGAVAKGTVVPMEQIPDAVFSQGIMGVCCGIAPKDGRVYSPADGVVSQLTDTIHAAGITAGEMELLIHAGVDTVEMKGEGFAYAVKEGQKVKKGDLLLTMDLDKVHAAGFADTIILAVTNSDDFAAVETVASGAVDVGDDLMKVSR